MEQKIKKIKPSFEYESNFKVSVYEPAFMPSELLNLIDIEKISKGKHKIEIGYLEGGCCRKNVFANIMNDQVISIEVEKCAEANNEKPTDEIAKIITETRKLMLKKYGSWQPLPVKALIENIASRSYDPIIGTGAGCFFICIWHYCIFCCTSTQPLGRPGCWIETRKLDVFI